MCIYLKCWFDFVMDIGEEGRYVFYLDGKIFI